MAWKIWFAEKRVSGWGVIRPEPWHLAGIFPTRVEAVERMERRGPGYIVRYGDGFRRSGDFFWASADE